MKKDVNDILNSLDSEDLGPLLRKEYGEDLDRQTKESIFKKVQKKTGLEKRPVYGRRIAAAVVAAILVISLSLGVYAYAADVKEYNEAVEYLGSIDYSTDGMSRKEIKSAYRKFKATVSLPDSAAEPVGVEEITGLDIISISTPSEDDAGGISYKLLNENEILLTGRYISKYNGGSVEWTFKDDAFQVTGYCPLADGSVVICGYTQKSEKEIRECYAELDENGRIIWRTVDEDERFSGLSIYFANRLGIFEDSDGTFLSIGTNSRGNGVDTERYITLTRLSKDGEIIDKTDTAIPDNTVLHACVRFGDGFIGKMSVSSDYTTSKAQYAALKAGNRQKYVKISQDGTVSSAFEFSDKNVKYTVNDIKEYNGKLYISADAITHDTGFIDVYNWGRACFLSRPLSELVRSGGCDCTDILKSKCEAVLLVCDPGSDEPLTFYKESAALSGAIETDKNGNLVWKTQSIEKGAAYYASNQSGAVNVIYSYTEYKYTFENGGKSALRTKTGTQTGVKF